MTATKRISIYVSDVQTRVSVPTELFDMLIEFRNKEQQRIYNDCIKYPERYLE